MPCAGNLPVRISFDLQYHVHIDGGKYPVLRIAADRRHDRAADLWTDAVSDDVRGRDRSLRRNSSRQRHVFHSDTGYNEIIGNPDGKDRRNRGILSSGDFSADSSIYRRYSLRGGQETGGDRGGKFALGGSWIQAGVRNTEKPQGRKREDSLASF